MRGNIPAILVRTWRDKQIALDNVVDGRMLLLDDDAVVHALKKNLITGFATHKHSLLRNQFNTPAFLNSSSLPLDVLGCVT